MTRERALYLRTMIEQSSALLPDERAAEAPELFPLWRPEQDYVRDQRVRWGGLLYRLIPEAHHSQADWTPDLVPAVWTPIAFPGEEWPQWRQPLGAEDAYRAGAKVSYDGKHWLNTYGDGNIWAPGVYGWTEQP